MSEYGDVEQTMVPGTLRGYREWVPTRNGLQAINFPFIWKPGVNTAQCAGFGGGRGLHALGLEGLEGLVHEAPVRDCTCGFYAKHIPLHPSETIAGVIKASGRVILGTTGFRAQYTEIEALYSRWDASTMLDRYNVPIYRDFDAMVRDFPPISVQHLLPEPDTLVNWQPPPIAWNVQLVKHLQAFLKMFNKHQPISGPLNIEEE